MKRSPYDEMANRVADLVGLTSWDVRHVMDEMVRYMTAAMATGLVVIIPPLGAWWLRRLLPCGRAGTEVVKLTDGTYPAVGFEPTAAFRYAVALEVDRILNAKRSVGVGGARPSEEWLAGLEVVAASRRGQWLERDLVEVKKLVSEEMRASGLSLVESPVLEGKTDDKNGDENG